MSNHTTNDASVKLCECGCGQPAPIAKRTNPQKGHIKGQPTRFAYGHHFWLPAENRFWAKVQKTDTCWLWTGGLTSGGYGVIELRGTTRQSIATHRFSWELHFGSIPDGMQILHKCDVRSCVNPDHLFLGTQADNVHDCVTKGRNRAGISNMNGETNGNSKLTDEQAIAIRAEYATGQTSSIKLAAKYGVSKPTILRIIHRETWGHI